MQFQLVLGPVDPSGRISCGFALLNLLTSIYALCFEAPATSDSVVRLEEWSRLIISLTGDASTEDIDISAADSSPPLSEESASYVFLGFCFSLP